MSNLPALKYPKSRGGKIQTYKILHCFYDPDSSNI